MAQHIIVVNYSSDWKIKFIKEAEIIRNILEDNCIEIHHIGSTAVEELKAKPIIDIMPIVKKLQMVDSVAYKFEQIGYEYLGEFGISGRRYLRKGGDNRTHQIHIFSEENINDVKRHLAVRDYLRNHKEVAKEYGRLKENLAEKFPYDIESYCDGKDSFLKNIEYLALMEYEFKIKDSKN